MADFTTRRRLDRTPSSIESDQNRRGTAMAFMGADTDALREAGEECQEGKEKTDQVIQYLRMLIMALRAASFFTGGASAAYADYLEGTVVPWLERISQALGLMAKVLMQNAQDQDDVSNSGSEVTGAPRAAISYSTPGGSMPAQRIGVWEGSLVPALAPGATSDTGSGFAAMGNLPASATSPGIASMGNLPASATSPGVFAPSGAVGSGSFGSGSGSQESWATRDHVGSLDTLSQSTLGGSSAGGIGSWDGTSASSSPDFATTGGTSGIGGIGGIGGQTPGVGGGAGGIGSSAGGAPADIGGGSSGLGSSSIGGGSPLGSPDAGGDESGTGLSSYSNGNLAGIGGSTPDSGASGDAALGAPTADGTVREGSGSYGAVAGVAGGAAALGLGGAALAGRSGAATDKRIEELGTQNGRGSRGAGVSELQRRLTEAGYDTKGTDGAWGRNTQAAYDAYRNDHPMAIRPGSGYTSPDGFDYTKIAHVQGNRHVTPEFLRGVEGVAQRLGTKPEHLLTAMSYESGFDPRADNPKSSAFGLIQFMDDTRAGLGVTQEQLSRMTATEQLPYVEKYFEHHRGKLGSLEAVYTSILAGRPAAPDDVLFREGSNAYRDNSQLDINKDGRLTAAEATTVVRRNLRN
ncbi:peptidoglycan-binding domain-containing protein [Nocardioides sp.]|uniref:peptidoglycan-binding domain-containing protein n=1 Tax=Nocardioides sp. TaxID=35761 RepID=UPI002C370BA5|nr:transglycosylase SLT domain-containing protein [Nocardioides sp.]HXH79858.1 transglycosylase SLT domain-containing protein [Nocardioides sp.]